MTELLDTATETLAGILRRRAVQSPDALAYVFLDEHGNEIDSYTYAELHCRAGTVASALASICAPGERALLVFPPGLDFVVAFFGCLYAGVIAVPVVPPHTSQTADITRRIVVDCDPAAVLGVGGFRPLVDRPWIAVDELGAAGSAEPVDAEANHVALLQYTSGSTAAPKGVMVTHGNLVANSALIARCMGHDAAPTVVGWAPLFHDQGLIGNVLQPMYLGVPAYLMSPAAFIRRPLAWLQAISKYRAHTSGGPNFAFDACVAHAERTTVPALDLSSWQVAFNGAEPLRAATLDRFAKAFAPYGFAAEALYPCYGLAEATLFVTGSRKGRGPRRLGVDAAALERGLVRAGARTLVGSGVVDRSVAIVDPHTGARTAADRVGEIWVSAAHVAAGYWGRPTDESFSGTLDGRRWLRTGDLGFVADGELYVAGRRKDLIVIRGRNLYPQDIELTVQQAHPDVRRGRCAAFAVDGNDGERLVVVAETRGAAAASDVVGSIRAAIVREHRATADVVLAGRGGLQLTSSGKIMRAAARNRYLAGEFR